MEKEYYTPKISDIRLGYECEITYAKDLIGTDDEYFIPYIVERQFFNEGDYVALRTPYLTKEQIEKEDWEFRDRLEGGSKERFEDILIKPFSSGYYSCSINQFQFVTISLWNCIDPTSPTSRTYWRGILPSINEFRYILTLLNIK